MLHITLTTGHTRRSPRSEVGDDVIEALRPTVIGLGGPVIGPGEGLYTVRIEPVGSLPDCLLRIDSTAGWRGLDCGLAAREAAPVWSALTAPGDAAMPDELPWLAAIVAPRLPPEDAYWLADYERCLAWTIIEESERQSRSAAAAILGRAGGLKGGAKGGAAGRGASQRRGDSDYYRRLRAKSRGRRKD